MSWVSRQLDDWVRLVQNSWLTFDRRTLGFSRILLGGFLVFDLFRRSAAWEEMFGDKGVLPTFVSTSKPQSQGFTLFHGFTTAPELWLLFAVMLTTYLCLMVGFKTKLMQVLSLFFVASANGRVLLIENGGYVVQNLLLLWTCFMPMGDRFSVDGLLASFQRKKERTAEELNDRSGLLDSFRLSPFVSVVGLAVSLQLAAIYYFNVLHKTGVDWKVNGSAVHYVLYVDRMVTPIVGDIRTHAPFPILKWMTFGVLSAEAAIPFCMLLPRLVIAGFDLKLWMRRAELVLIQLLHIGFGSTFVLGPFAWSLCVFSTLLVSPQDWTLASRVMRRGHRARTVVLDTSSGAALLFARLVARLDRFELVGFAEAEGQEENADEQPEEAKLNKKRRASKGSRRRSRSHSEEETAEVASSKGSKVKNSKDAVDGAPLSLKRIQFAEAIKDREPVDPEETFSMTNTGKLYAFLELSNQSEEEEKVTVTFVPPMGGATKVTLDVGPQKRWRTWALRKAVSASGTWRVVVRDSHGKELGSRTFEVTE